MKLIKIFATRLVIILVIVSAITLLTPVRTWLSSQKSTPNRTHVLRTALMAEPVTFDPRLCSDTISEVILSSLFCGLTYRDRDETIHPGLAEEIFVSADLQEYRFHLKKTYWSDGSPLLAQHIANSWKSCLDPLFPCGSCNLFYSIAGAREAKQGKIPLDAVGIFPVDDYTLIIQLETPTPYFKEMLAHPVFSPVHPSLLAKPIEEKELRSGRYISCGAFRLKEFKIQQELLIEKNPFYWDAGSVKLDGVHFAIIPDANTALMMFEEKRLDWIGAPLSEISLDALPDLQKTGRLGIKSVAGTKWLEFNTEKFPFHNKNIRKALSLALNRRDLIEHIMQLQDPPALGLIPFVQKNSIYKQGFYEDNARKLSQEYFALGLQELGITAEQFPTLVLSYNSSEIWKRMVQAISQQWSSTLGISVRLEGLEWKVHVAKLETKDFQIGRYGWGAQFNDPINFLELFKFKNGSNNHTNWENEEYIHNLNLSNQIADPLQRAFYLARAEEILMEANVIVPIHHISNSFLTQPNVKDVYLDSLCSVRFNWTYFDDAN